MIRPLLLLVGALLCLGSVMAPRGAGVLMCAASAAIGVLTSFWPARRW